MRFVAIYVLCLLLILSPNMLTAQEPFGSEAEITLHNTSADYMVCGFDLYPLAGTNSSESGRMLLLGFGDSWFVNPGESKSWSIPTGRYRAEVKLCLEPNYSGDFDKLLEFNDIVLREQPFELSVNESAAASNSTPSMDESEAPDVDESSLLGEDNIELVNGTPQVEICYVMVAEAESDVWSDDQLAATKFLGRNTAVRLPIDPIVVTEDTATRWSLAPGFYRALAVSCTHNSLGAAVFEVVPGESVQLTYPQDFVSRDDFYGPLSYGGPQYFTAQVTVENVSDDTICNIETTALLNAPVDDRVMPPSSALLPGNYIDFEVASGFHTIRLEDCTGKVLYESEGVNVLESYIIRYSGDDAVQIEQTVRPHVTFNNHSTEKFCGLEFDTLDRKSYITPNKYQYYLPPRGAVSVPMRPGVYQLWMHRCQEQDAAEGDYDFESFIISVKGDTVLDYPEVRRFTVDSDALLETLPDESSAVYFGRGSGNYYEDPYIYLSPEADDVDSLAAYSFRAGRYSLAGQYYQGALTLLINKAEPAGVDVASIGEVPIPSPDNVADMNAAEQARYMHLLNRIGDTYRLRGEYVTANRYYDRVLGIADQITLDTVYQGVDYRFADLLAAENWSDAEDTGAIGLDKLLAPYNAALEGKGLLYVAQGRDNDAVGILNEALGIGPALDVAAIDPDDLETVIDAFSDEMSVQLYADVDVFEDQSQLKPEAMLIPESSGFASMLYGFRAERASLYGTLGDIYARNGGFSTALDYYSQALALYDSEKTISDLAVPKAIVYQRIGRVYAAQQRYELASKAYWRAFEVFREHGENVYIAQLLVDMAQLFQLQDNADTSLSTYEAALTLLAHTEDQLTQLYAQLGYAEVLFDAGRSDQALTAYQHGIELFETLLTSSKLDISITHLLRQASVKSAYQNVVLLLVAQGDDAVAFDYSERSRAVLTRTQLSETQEPLHAGVNAVDKRLLIEIEALQQSLREDTFDGSADLARLRETLQETLEAAQVQNGLYQRVIADTASVDAVRNMLSADEVLLSYNVGVEKSVVFVVTPDTIRAEILNVNEAQLNQAYRRFVNSGRTNVDEVTAVMSELYDALLAPLDLSLPPETHLLFASDNVLNYIPFSALIQPDETYLIEDYVVSQVPSATAMVLLASRSTESTPVSAGLVMGQPEPNTLQATRLNYLDHVEEEAKQVADFLGVDALIGSEASELALRQNAAGAQVLHIAAHVEMLSDYPYFSRIHLTPDTLGQTDGYLEVYEVSELDLRQGTNLVILSGCDTGSGGDGEDFGILTRSFLGAGANEVVASLWRVDDAATTDLMVAFHKERAQGLDNAHALRQAMLTILQQSDTQAPYYWASFMLIGQPQKSSVTPIPPTPASLPSAATIFTREDAWQSVTRTFFKSTEAQVTLGEGSFLRIENRSQTAICQVYLVPLSERNGVNVLAADNSIVPGSSAAWQTDADSYNLLIYDCIGNEVARMPNLDLANPITYVYPSGSIVPAGEGDDFDTAVLPSSDTTEDIAVAPDVICPGAPPPQMVIGEAGRVVVARGIPNRLRDAAGTEGSIIGTIPEGAVFAVLSGPVCAEEYLWWEVNFDGQRGWTAEGEPGNYYIEPIELEACIIIANSRVNLRAGAGTEYDIVSTIGAGESRVVFGSTRTAEGKLWWLLLDDSAWVSADVVTANGYCADVSESE